MDDSPVEEYRNKMLDWGLPVRGKVILQSQGKEFFTWHGKEFFT